MLTPPGGTGDQNAATLGGTGDQNAATPGGTGDQNAAAPGGTGDQNAAAPGLSRLVFATVALGGSLTALVSLFEPTILGLHSLGGPALPLPWMPDYLAGCHVERSAAIAALVPLTALALGRWPSTRAGTVGLLILLGLCLAGANYAFYFPTDPDPKGTPEVVEPGMCRLQARTHVYSIHPLPAMERERPGYSLLLGLLEVTSQSRRPLLIAGLLVALGVFPSSGSGVAWDHARRRGQPQRSGA